MNRAILALAAAVATTASFVPLTASAQRHGGGGGGGMRSAPAPVAAPQMRPAAPSGGFDLHEDMTPARTTPPIQRPVVPQTPITVQRPITVQQPVVSQRPASQRPVLQRPVVQRPVSQRPVVQQNASRPAQQSSQQLTQRGIAGQERGATQGHRPALVANLGYGGQRGNRRVIPDRRYRGGAWGWNHGATWNPAPNYWGGGFWGPFGFGGAVALFGAIAFDDATVDSYQVEPDSPGAELLDNYGLTQVPCGPPDLVVIFGPDNSVICADPNDSIARGEYQLDPSDLTIVSLDS